MKKKRIILSSVLLVLVITLGIVGYRILKPKNTISPNAKGLALYVADSNSGVGYSPATTFSTVAEAVAQGYVLDETASQATCTNGSQIHWNSETNIISLTTTSATTCNFIFKMLSRITILSRGDGSDTSTATSSNLAVGDKIQIGDENFWVISNTNGTIRALAEYNINVGSNKNPSVTEGLQNESVRGYRSGGGTKYGNVAFSSSSSTYSGSAYEGYINSYISLLVSTYGLNAGDISGDAITKTELETLGCNSSSNTCSGSSYPWVYTTSYWSGSAYSSSLVWDVRSDGLFGRYSCGSDSPFGVRPVIELNASEFIVEPVYKVITQAGSSLTTGDKIAIGDENFWVISNTNGTIRALAEYNINVGSNKNPSVTEGLQDESVKGRLQSGTKYGNVAFDSSGTTYAGSALEGYINDYIDLIVSTYGLNASDIRGDAITYTELETLECDGSSDYTCSGSTYSWVYTTSYWSGSAYDSNYVWDVNSNGDFDANGYYNGYYFGVRPVVILSESLF